MSMGNYSQHPFHACYLDLILQHRKMCEKIRFAEEFGCILTTEFVLDFRKQFRI